jgi:hypothetical protein
MIDLDPSDPSERVECYWLDYDIGNRRDVVRTVWSYRTVDTVFVLQPESMSNLKPTNRR